LITLKCLNIFRGLGGMIEWEGQKNHKNNAVIIHVPLVLFCFVFGTEIALQGLIVYLITLTLSYLICNRHLISTCFLDLFDVCGFIN
jgi:hypothetical protein